MDYRRHCSTLQARTNPHSVCNFLTGVFKHFSLLPFCETQMSPVQVANWRAELLTGHPWCPQGLPKAATPQQSPTFLLEEAGAAEGSRFGFFHSLSPFMLCHQLAAADLVNQIRRASSAGTQHIFSGRLALTQRAIPTPVCWMPLRIPRLTWETAGDYKTSIFWVNSDSIKISQGATILNIYISVCLFPKFLILLSIFTVLCPVPPKPQSESGFQTHQHITRA